MPVAKDGDAADELKPEPEAEAEGKGEPHFDLSVVVDGILELPLGKGKDRGIIILFPPQGNCVLSDVSTETVH